jgi:hypothetical protein
VIDALRSFLLQFRFVAIHLGMYLPLRRDGELSRILNGKIILTGVALFTDKFSILCPDKWAIIAYDGEEITLDYAMCESPEYEMKCNCGYSDCRKVVTGNGWKNKELQKKHKGFFSDYLQKKIARRGN